MRDDILPSNGCFIINLESKDEDGSHWTAVYEKEYYDSFGLPPPNELKHLKLYNRMQHQGTKSPLCGLFAVSYIYLRNRGYSPYYINYRIFEKVTHLGSERNYEIIEKILKSL